MNRQQAPNRASQPALAIRGGEVVEQARAVEIACAHSRRHHNVDDAARMLVRLLQNGHVGNKGDGDRFAYSKGHGLDVGLDAPLQNFDVQEDTYDAAELSAERKRMSPGHALCEEAAELSADGALVCGEEVEFDAAGLEYVLDLGVVAGACSREEDKYGTVHVNEKQSILSQRRRTTQQHTHKLSTRTRHKHKMVKAGPYPGWTR